MEGSEYDSDDEDHDSHDQEERRPSNIDTVFRLDSRDLVNAFDGHVDDDRSDSAVEAKSPPLTDIDGEDKADGSIGNQKDERRNPNETDVVAIDSMGVIQIDLSEGDGESENA